MAESRITMLQRIIYYCTPYTCGEEIIEDKDE